MFVAKSRRLGADATVGDIEALLTLPTFSDLKTFQKDGSFRIIDSGSSIPGTDFRSERQSHVFSQALAHVRWGAAVLGLKGEANSFTANGIADDHYRLLLARDIETRRTMGVFWDLDEHEAPTPIILRVPAGIRPTYRYGKAIVGTQFLSAPKAF